MISGETAIPYYKFYERLDIRNPEKIARSSSPYIGITEHPTENGRLILALNYTPEERSAKITLSRGKFERFINVSGGECKPCADGFEVILPKNSGIVAVVKE